MINPAPIASQSSLNVGDHEELKFFLSNRLIPSQFNQELSLQRDIASIYREVCVKLVDRGPRRGFHSVWFQPSDCAKSVGSWSMTRIPLHVISAVGLRRIGGIVAHDADSTPCDFSRPIARFNPDRLISLFTPSRHHVGIHVGLRGPAMCPHRATSPLWVPRD